MRTLRMLAVISLAIASASVAHDVLACGGTFCDTGPTARPVDQTGENILFVLDGQNVEAHVQIQYTGGAARFAWVVPMPKVPDVTVGSQTLFTSLLQSTVPNYGFTNQFDQCSQSGSNAGGFISTGGGSTTGGTGTGGTTGGGGVVVVVNKTVGAFQVQVLQGGTAQEVSTWLDTNGFASVPTAPTLLQGYVDKQFVFVAVKLTAGANVNEIHPLVFKYAGTEPCIPLKLTAVAAQPDMGVRAFFLGDDRVFPLNYKHVTLNQVRVDWLQQGTNYNAAVSRAVDSAGPDGHAFLTEYAGPSNVVSSSGLVNPTWNAAAFHAVAPEKVIDTLATQGLAYCYSNGTTRSCTNINPVVLPLLEQYLPAPATVDETTFYACLSCYTQQIDRTKWDGNAFGDAFQTRVIDPGVHAQTLLTKWPYLTRLFTTIDPAEMTEDPTFKAIAAQSSNFVAQMTSFASLRTTCCSTRGMILPAVGSAAAREVAVSSAWPPFSSLMPWAEKVEQVSLLGDITTLADNTMAIDKELANWNASQNWPPSAACAATGGSATAGATGAATAGGVTGGAASGGGASSDGGLAGVPSGGGGCSVSPVGNFRGASSGSGSAPAVGAGLVGLALAALRRRRRSH